MMIGQMMKVKTGNQGVANDSFEYLFQKQAHYQLHVTREPVLPVDHPVWMQYHVAAMVEELGEMLKADKRWKTHRNAFYDKENKLEELSDIFVTAINLALFSGFSAEQMFESISAKISENLRKLEEAQGK